MPISDLLYQFEEDYELHKLRFEKVKNTLIDLEFGIKSGYFKDGTKAKYEVVNNNGEPIISYDWIEIFKRMPFVSNSDSFYYFSWIKI